MNQVVGTLTSIRELTVFGHPIQVRNAPPNMVGKRVKLTGNLRFGRLAGAYFQVSKCNETEDPDDTGCVVSGRITSIMEIKPHPRYGESACVIIQQGESDDTKVLISFTSPRSVEAAFDSLVVGQTITVGGYVNYHKRGLHVLFVKYVDVQ